jgi:hypothetical protein
LANRGMETPFPDSSMWNHTVLYVASSMSFVYSLI